MADGWSEQRAARFAEHCRDASAWPLPARGETAQRLALLSGVAFDDLVVGRLVEAHADALAILAELDGPLPSADQRWGVWAAGPADSVVALRKANGWLLNGAKPWCSGVSCLTHALVTATCDGERLLFAVALDDAEVGPSPPSWTGAGMAAADTRTVCFADAPAAVVGGQGEYLGRPGFWAGALGVAACWFGGTVRLGTLLKESAEARDDPHVYAHLGAVHASVMVCRSALRDAAMEIDHRPGGDHRITALAVRSAVERTSVAVIDRVGRALGPAPLAHREGHGQLVADLMVYVRQHHAERDLEALGRGVAGQRTPWLMG